MTADTALRLERWLGVSAAFWMNLQKRYELDLAREKSSVDIALLQVLEQARKSLNVSEKELAERMGIQRTTVTRLFNASHPNPTLDTISDILRALGLQAEIKINPASTEDMSIPIKARFVPA